MHDSASRPRHGFVNRWIADHRARMAVLTSLVVHALLIYGAAQLRWSSPPTRLLPEPRRIIWIEDWSDILSELAPSEDVRATDEKKIGETAAADDAPIVGESPEAQDEQRSPVREDGDVRDAARAREDAEAGRSVASTMGFTPVDGLPMGTRCGSLDPGVILYMMDELKMDARAVEKLIYQQSGLLGVSGVSSDMRTLLASDEPGAKAAVDLFVYRIRRELGSLAAALGGLEAIVFTAGIGENSAALRERVCRDAAWLGVELDNDANARGGPRISTPASKVTAWVIPTNEELMIARHTSHVLAQRR